MENSLEDLNSQARRLVGHFRVHLGHPERLTFLIRDLQDPNSNQRQKIEECRNLLEETQHNFGHGGDYLNPSTILRSLLRKTHTQPLPKALQPWRPDDIICKANLAILVYFALTHAAGEETVDAEVALDQKFPTPFMLGFTKSGMRHRAGYSSLLSESFEFALDLRTQVLVGKLNGSLTTGAAALMIERAMLEFDDDTVEPNENDAVQNLHAALSDSRNAKGWGSHLDPQAFESSKYADLIIRRTEEIRKVLFDDIEDPFTNPSATVGSGLGKLRQQFSWERFQKKLLRWANLRLTEIDNSIKRLGGIDEIVTALEKEIRQRLDDPDAYDDEDGSEEDVLPKVRNHDQSISHHATPGSTSRCDLASVCKRYRLT
jgi:hypothetical protein